MASKKTTLKVTINGTVETRTTARTYTHVVVAYNPASGEWGVMSWHGTHALATKALTRSIANDGRRAAQLVAVVGETLELETPTLAEPVHSFTLASGEVVRFWCRGAHDVAAVYDRGADRVSFYRSHSAENIREQIAKNAAYSERIGEPVKDIRVIIFTGEASAQDKSESVEGEGKGEAVELTTELDHTIEDTDTTITVMNVRRDGRTLGTVRVYAAHGELDLSGTVYIDDRPDLWLDFMAPDEAGLDGAIAETLAWVAERL